MTGEERILALLEQVQGQLGRLEESQAVIEYEISEMKTRQNKTTATLTDIQRDQVVLKQSQSKIQLDVRDVKVDLVQVRADIAQVKADASITREVVNGVSEWTEIASDVLKIRYPVDQ